MAQIKKIDELTRKNEYFRQVLATSKHTQVVVMSIKPGEDIGMEVHEDNDQVLYLMDGSGQVVLNGQSNEFNKDDLVLVPAGTEHNFIAGGEGMKILTSYSPPHHPDGTVHKTKAEAEAAEDSH